VSAGSQRPGPTAAVTRVMERIVRTAAEPAHYRLNFSARSNNPLKAFRGAIWPIQIRFLRHRRF
jgi:hypothetical protein